MVAMVGMTCLGFVISYVCMMVARRSEYDGISVAGSVLGILLGGLLAMYLAGRTTAGQDIIWWYPIGMLAALVLVGGVTSVKGAVTYVKDAKIRAKRGNKQDSKQHPPMITSGREESPRPPAQGVVMSVELRDLDR